MSAKRDYGDVPSVTHIIGATLRNPGLEKWRGGVGNEAADAAMRRGADFGTAVHDGIEAMLTEDDFIPIFADREVNWCVQEYQDWHEAHVAEVVAIELAFIDTTYGYAGTADLVARLEGEDFLTLIDWKTGKADPRTSESYRLQTAAYAGGIERTHGHVIAARKVVKLRPKEPATITEYDERALDEASFLCCLGLYRWRAMRGAA